jgi:enoyl-CoA hydratase/carnithine racemase
MTADGSVRYARDGSVAHVTIDRPSARNAMTWSMYEELRLALDRAESDAKDGLRVLVFRGAGGSFVAGTDIAQFAAFRSPEDGVVYERLLESVVSRVEKLAVPTLAAIEGHAVGGGLVLAAACDVRICTPDALFGAPIARTVGNCLSIANHARLMVHLGASRTKSLLMTGRLMDAGEALAAGFVQEVVPVESLDACVASVAQSIASNASATLRTTKEAVSRLLAALPVPEGEDLIREAYGSPEFAERVRRFRRETRKTDGRREMGDGKQE